MSQLTQPTVGRIVHITLQGSPEHVPGIITYVHPAGAHRSDPERDGTLINIGCWDPAGNPTPGLQGVPEDQSGVRSQSWHWPEYITTNDVDEDGEEEPEPEEE